MPKVEVNRRLRFSIEDNFQIGRPDLEAQNKAITEIINGYFEQYIQANLDYFVQKIGLSEIKKILDNPQFDRKDYDLCDDDILVIGVCHRLINGDLSVMEVLMSSLMKMNYNRDSINKKIAEIMPALFEKYLKEENVEEYHFSRTCA